MRRYESRFFTPLVALLLTGLAIIVPARSGEDVSPADSEGVLAFDSHVRIRADGFQVVTETIRFVAKGKKIRRGIYRDLPLGSGGGPKTTFKMLTLVIDGTLSPNYEVTRSAGGVRVIMGDKRKLIEHGEHTFILTYETSGHVRFFDDHDEFGWNVTGDRWEFPIEKVSCRIDLPETGSIGDVTGWLGRRGSTDSPIDVSYPADNAALFVARRQLAPGEHFTVAVCFPKDLVSGPEWREYVVNIAILLLTFGFFFLAWWSWGRDPRPGTVIPEFRPPEAGYYGKPGMRPGEREGEESVMSPAAVAYVKNGAILTDKGFAGLFLSLAAKGWFTISRHGDSFVLTPQKNAREATGELSAEELIVYRTIADPTSEHKDFVLDERNAGAIRSMHDAVVETLGRRYAPLWNQNLGIQAIGWLVILPAAVLAMNAAGLGNPFAALLPPALIAAVIHLVRKQISYSWSRSINCVNPVKRVAVVVAVAALVALRARAFGLIVVIGSLLYNQVQNLTVWTVVLVAIPVLFCPVMGAPSRVCRRLLDRIDGLALYIGVAERERLQALNPPEETPETFERLLPYAVALGLEDTWCSRFAAQLSVDF